MAFFPNNDITSSGSITTQNANPNSGTATANSTVALSTLDGRSVATIQVTGTYTGALTPQVTIDGSNWVNLSNYLVNQFDGSLNSTIPSAAVGVYQIDIAGFAGFRISSLGASPSGTAVVTIRASFGIGSVSVDQTQNQDISITGQSAQTATVNNILTTTAGSAWTDCINQATNISYRSFTVQIVSTGTAGTFIFEGSNDGVNPVTIPVLNITLTSGTVITAAITASASSLIYGGSLPFRYLRVRIVTAITGGSIQAFTKLSTVSYAPTVTQVAQTNSASLNATVSSISTSVTPGTSTTNLGKAEDAASASGDVGVFTLGVRSDSPVAAGTTNTNGDYSQFSTDKYGNILDRSYEKTTKTYSASANISSAASATDIFTITGNATTNVFVTKVIVSGIQTTAGLTDVQLVKRSTANSSGTFTTVTAIPHDSGDAAASATLLAYTANPTTGTAVGSVRRGYVPIAGATSVVNPIVTFDFGALGKPITLIGTAQVLAVNLGGVTVTGGTFDVSIEWFEI